MMDDQNWMISIIYLHDRMHITITTRKQQQITDSKQILLFVLTYEILFFFLNFTTVANFL